MSLWDEIATDAQAAWFDTNGLAQTVIYTQPARETGTVKVESSIPAVISYGENPGGTGQNVAAEMVALIPRDSIATPRRDGDTITVNGEVWRVHKIKAGDALGISWQLECSRKGQRVVRGAQ
jgi:hypothetical protein